MKLLYCLILMSSSVYYYIISTNISIDKSGGHLENLSDDKRYLLRFQQDDTKIYSTKHHYKK